MTFSSLDVPTHTVALNRRRPKTGLNLHTNDRPTVTTANPLSSQCKGMTKTIIVPVEFRWDRVGASAVLLCRHRLWRFWFVVNRWSAVRCLEHQPCFTFDDNPSFYSMPVGKVVFSVNFISVFLRSPDPYYQDPVFSSIPNLHCFVHCLGKKKNIRTITSAICITL